MNTFTVVIGDMGEIVVYEADYVQVGHRGALEGYAANISSRGGDLLWARAPGEWLRVVMTRAQNEDG